MGAVLSTGSCRGADVKKLRLEDPQMGVTASVWRIGSAHLVVGLPEP